MSSTYTLSLNRALLLALHPTQQLQWQSQSTHRSEEPNLHPFQHLVESLNLTTIKAACRRSSTDTITKSARKPDIHITTKDIHDLISFGIPIYHELLVLSLEALCIQYQAAYLDPSFYPILLTQGPQAVLRRFAPQLPSTIDRPSLHHPNIALPLHINGDHWVGLGRRIINGTTFFYYADDLNSPTTEQIVRQRIATIPGLMPPSSQWIRCHNYTYHPHSNECGPRPILSLAVIMSHPHPHGTMLQQNMNGNLAMQARTWMSHLLVAGHSPLLAAAAPCPPLLTGASTSHPSDFLQWTAPHAAETTSAHHSPSMSRPSLASRFSTQTNSPIEHPPPHRRPSDPSPQTRPDDLPILRYPKLPAQKSTTPPEPATKAMRTKGRPKKVVKPPNQLTLHDFSTSFHLSAASQPSLEVTSDIWGHALATIERDSTFRLLLQNPHGLKLCSDRINTQYSLAICQDLEVGAICLPETNTNWGHRAAHSTLSGLLWKTWRHTTYSTLYTNHNFENLNQPGGTAQILTSNWTSRVIDKGIDPFGLGRWSFFTMRGARNKLITLITAYRVCSQSIHSAGQTTATAQQFRALSKALRENNSSEDPRPRWQFIMDLQAWIENLIASQHDIILSIDANEAIYGLPGTYNPLLYAPDRPTVGSGHDGSLATLIRTCSLVDLLLIQHPDQPPPPTYSRGSSHIDYILISGSLLPAVQRSGILPYDSVFISDHRPTYVDFDPSILFRDITSNIALASRRGLQVQDPRIISSYHEHLRKQLDYHNLPAKIQALQDAASSTTPSPDLSTQYDMIDRLLTESMLRAERLSSKRYSTKF